MVINPKIIDKIDKFNAPVDIKQIIKYLLAVQDNSELENSSPKSVLQMYEKFLAQYASRDEIITFCKKYQA